MVGMAGTSLRRRPSLMRSVAGTQPLPSLRGAVQIREGPGADTSSSHCPTQQHQPSHAWAELQADGVQRISETRRELGCKALNGRLHGAPV